MNFIKQGWHSRISEDDTIYPKGEATVGDKANKYTRLSVYGIDSNPPLDSHILLFDSRGQESNQFGLVNDFENRKKDLKEGEVAVHNTKTGAYMHLKEDGNMELLGSGDFAVRYLELETAFNQLQSDFDDLVTAYNSHTHVYVPGTLAAIASAPTTATGSPSTADITPAKVAEIEVPS